ncbi:hypothetical protein OAO87_03875, partial [bacterium]|nr:hypothetical protein [bacterium]
MNSVTFRNHVGPAMINAYVAITWKCSLGQYMPKTGTFDAMDFTGCAFLCPPGTIGTRTDLESAADCAPCTEGHFCDAYGLNAGIPCRYGTRMPTTGARSADACIPCRAPGHFNNQTGQEECATCRAGSFSEGDEAVQCTLCERGGYCPEANASNPFVFQPCQEDTYNPNMGESRESACIPCAVGAISERGAAECFPVLEMTRDHCASPITDITLCQRAAASIGHISVTANEVAGTSPYPQYCHWQYATRQLYFSPPVTSSSMGDCASFARCLCLPPSSAPTALPPALPPPPAVSPPPTLPAPPNSPLCSTTCTSVPYHIDILDGAPDGKRT